MKSLTGTVVSLKMKDTAVVLVEYTVVHPKYKKIMKRSNKIKAHNTLTDVQLGDVVAIVSSRPMSRDKHFVVKEVIKKSVNQLASNPEPVRLAIEENKPKRKKNKETK